MYMCASHLRSLSMIFTVEVCLTNSPIDSTAPNKAESWGVNLRITVSSYSRVTSSFVANRRMSALESSSTVIGSRSSKSVFPVV